MRRGLLFSVLTLTVLAIASPPAVLAIVIQNPWITNDRVADTHNITTMGATYVNAYTPNGVVTPANNNQKGINIYNNQKRRLYHWTDEPPAVGGNDINDPTYNQNVFGWGLCGRNASQGSRIGEAAGFTAHKMLNQNPGHWVYQLTYDGDEHMFDTMCTAYFWNKAVPSTIASNAQMTADSSIILNSQADGRACPGLLLCGDDINGYQQIIATMSDMGGSGVTCIWNGNMNIRTGEVFYRGCDSWVNEHPPIGTGGGTTPPYHHEASHDKNDTVNYPYWAPYELTSAQSTAINITYTPTYRRWANGTDTVTPDFRTVNYQDLLYSSTNIATYYSDGVTPDLHANTVGTLAEAVFKIQFPFYLTDGTVSGNFTRTNSSDITAIYTSPDGTTWTQVWNNTATGTTNLSNLSLRNQVFGNYNAFFVKVQIQSTNAKTDAGVTGLTFAITYEHNKGSMPYLDLGVNNLSFSCDNISALGSGYKIKLDYKWREYDNGTSDWTISKAYTKYISTSPATFKIVTGGGSKKNMYDGIYYPAVPRTEYIQMTVVPNPAADTTAPAAVSNLAAGSAGRTSIPLTWTAPGNDGSTGEATGYDLRYSTSTINAGNFSSATQITTVTFPRQAGETESFSVTGLSPSTTYYFAVKAYDDSGNYATISNVISKATMALDTQAPNAVTNLAATPNSTLGSWNITWTAPSDNGNGYVASYDLRWSTSAITSGNFSSATKITGLGTPKSGGQAESFTATGLPTGQTLYFAIESADDSNNVSAISNVPSASQMIGTLTLQNGLTVNGSTYAGAQDTYMSAAAVTTKYDGSTYLQIAGMGAGTNRRRPIVKFDLSCLPSRSTITQAKLYLYAYSNENHDASGGYYGAYHVFTGWSAPAVSWNMPWVQYGGSDCDTLDGQTAKQTTSNVWYAIDVTSRVQRFINGQDANNGWTIHCTDETLMNQDWFYACEYATDTTLRPKLVLSDVSGPDTTPPAAVSNLTATAAGMSGMVNLSWTAPGDDGNTGTATSYNVRYSTSTITDANFASATAVSGIGAPKAAGQTENYTVSGLTNGTTYYFALKTSDEVPNVSALSNVASAVPAAGTKYFQNGQNGYAGCVDSYMNAGSATTNYGTNTRMTVCGYSDQGATNVNRGIVKFDVSSYPTNATITRATLYLYSYQSTGTAGSYGVYPLTRAFTEGQVTWTISATGTNWTTGGGDFNSTADATAAKQSAGGVWYQFDVTSRVQNWINTPANNMGWVVKFADETAHSQDLFYTSDYTTDATLRPKLVVTDQTGFTVTTTASPSIGGTISGGGNYNNGATCTLTATPASTYGYTFNHWSGGSINGSTTNPIGFTVTTDVAITAVFTPPAGYIDVTNYTDLKTAIQTTAVAGNTIRVFPGTYTMPSGDTALQLNNHGSSGNPINVTGILNGSQRPILTSSGQNINRGFFYSNTADSYWTFSNLEFQNLYDTVGQNAAAAYINGSNVTFTNCKIHDCDQGFSSASTATNTLLQYCEVYNTGNSLNPGFAHEMYMTDASLTVRGCYLHDPKYGQCFKTRCGNLTFEYNWVENEGAESLTGGLASGNANNAVLRGNVFIKRSTGSTQPGLVYVSDGGAGISGTVTFINNTFLSGSSSDAYIYHNANSTANVVLKNNVFAGPSNTLFSWYSGIPYTQLSGTNNAFTTGMNPVPSQLVNNYYLSSAGFVNQSGHDLHLAAGSGCINVGQNGPTYLNASGVATDGTPAYEATKTLVLDTRVNDGAIDIGAYEYHTATPTVQFSSATGSGSESVTSVNIPVTLSFSSSQTVTVNYAVTGGTATGGGVDYTLTSGTLTFNAGVTSQNIAMTVVNDSLNETNETVVVTLSSPTNTTLGGITAYTYTINDDDAAPTVQFSSATGSGSESVTSVTIPVTLSAASGQTVTVNYAVTGGTATGGGVDYTLNSGTLTFSPGTTTQNITMTVVDDSLVEGNETVVITLSSPSNATLGTNTTYTYTINDNDSLPTVQFSSASGNGSESATSVTIPVTLSASSTQTVTVNYAVTGGTATGGGVDYTLSSGTLTFSAGVTTQNITMTVVDDSIVESNETVVITLSSPSNATLGTNTTYTYTINDNDSAGGQSVNFETAGDETKFTTNNIANWVRASGHGGYMGQVTTYNGMGTMMYTPSGGYNQGTGTVSSDVDLVYCGTAGAGAMIGLICQQKSATEQYEVVLQAVNGTITMWVGCLDNWAATATNHTAYVSQSVGTYTQGSSQQDLGWYNVSCAISTVNTDQRQLLVTLTKPDTTQVQLTYTDSGSARWTTTSYPAGYSAYCQGYVASNVDNFTASGGSSTPTVQFSSASGSGSEATTSVSIPVTLSASSSQTVTVNYAVTGGTATGGGVDYTLSSGTLTFNPGVTSQNISMTVVNDTLYESNETVVVTLSSPANATLGTNTTYTYTITDNDTAPTVQFSSATGSGSESVTSVTIPVTLSAASGLTTTVNYAVTGGTATGGGVDYTLSSGTLTFNAGVTTQNITMTVVDDSLTESNETVVITLSSPSNATLGTNTTYTYTIIDNDSGQTVNFETSGDDAKFTTNNLAGWARVAGHGGYMGQVTTYNGVGTMMYNPSGGYNQGTGTVSSDIDLIYSGTSGTTAQIGLIFQQKGANEQYEAILQASNGTITFWVGCLDVYGSTASNHTAYVSQQVGTYTQGSSQLDLGWYNISGVISTVNTDQRQLVVTLTKPDTTQVQLTYTDSGSARYTTAYPAGYSAYCQGYVPSNVDNFHVGN